MTRWLSDERVIALRAAGRLHDMSDAARTANRSPQPSPLARASLTPNGAATAVAKRSHPNVAPLYPLVTLCRSMKIAEPKPEHRFHPTRKWRFDYAWPAHMLALEVDGGVWTQGRHTRGAGAIADMEKLSEAAILGWRVLYAIPDQLHNGVALDRIIRALTDREAA